MAFHKQWRAEAVECPGPTRSLDALECFSKNFLQKYYLFVSQYFRRPFFSHIPNFSLFRVSFQISRKFAPCMSPVLHHVPITTFLSSFFSHLPTFLSKTGPLDVRGRRTVRIPSARYCK